MKHELNFSNVDMQYVNGPSEKKVRLTSVTVPAKVDLEPAKSDSCFVNGERMNGNPKISIQG